MPASVLLAQQKHKASHSASKPFQLGIVDEIPSKILSENRTLNIYLPPGYDTDAAKTYPVIYLLDGSANEDFVHIVGLVQFMNMIEALPPTIVVGIANVDRKRDFTFPTTVAQDKKDFPTTGKSAPFISFIEKELQPYISRSYRVNKDKTLIGQSLGGLLASEILLKQPQLFNNYIIVSPSLWWDNESLLAQAPGLLQSLPAGAMKVYIAVGTEGKEMEEGAAKLNSLLALQRKPNLTLVFNPMPAENHLTILHNSVYQAFQKLYPKN